MYLIQSVTSASYPACLDKSQDKAICPLDGSKGICAIIKAIALTTLKEMVALTAVSTIGAFFVTTQFGMASLVLGVIATVCVNLFLRIISGGVFLACAERDPETHGRKIPEGKAKKFISLVEYLAPIGYSSVHFNTVDTLLHEGGHALAAKALYRNAEPQIVLMPYVGGRTEFFPHTLSWIGNLLGANKSNMVIAAAGPAAAVTTAAAELALADHFEKSHPRLSRYLKVLGCMNIASHLFYAYSAFAETTSSATASPVSGHDFVRLWSGGVHPYASMVSILALPLIVKTGIYLTSKHTTRQPAAALSTG